MMQSGLCISGSLHHQGLKKWSKKKVSWARVVTSLTNDVIFNLDVAQEIKVLTLEKRKSRNQSFDSKRKGVESLVKVNW
jgi:thymidylate kinase